MQSEMTILTEKRFQFDYFTETYWSIERSLFSQYNKAYIYTHNGL